MSLGIVSHVNLRAACYAFVIHAHSSQTIHLHRYNITSKNVKGHVSRSLSHVGPFALMFC